MISLILNFVDYVELAFFYQPKESELVSKFCLLLFYNNLLHTGYSEESQNSSWS